MLCSRWAHASCLLLGGWGDKSWDLHCSWWDRTQLHLPNKQQDSSNFHGIYEVSMELCLIRWSCYATRLQPHWVPVSSSAISSPFLPSHLLHLLRSLPEMLFSHTLLSFIFLLQLSAQMLSSGTLPWPLLFSEGTLPHSVLTLHIVSTVVPPLSFFHGMYPDWGWAEIWRPVDLQ